MKFSACDGERTLRGMGRRWLDRRTRREVAVHLTDGTSLAGVLWEVCPDVLVLRHARALTGGTDAPVEADGDVAVPRGRVSWVQVLGGAR